MENIEFTDKEIELITKFADIVMYPGNVSIKRKEDFIEIKKVVLEALTTIEDNIDNFSG